MSTINRNVIINDYDETMLTLLKEDYERRIAEIKSVARAQSVSLSEKNIIASREKEEAKMERSLKKKQKNLSQELVSKTHYELQKQSEKKEMYLAEGMSLIEHELSRLDETTKVALTKKLFEELKVSIEKAGYDKKDFVFSVYKGASIPGTKPHLQEIAIIAEKDTIRFADSLKDRLKESELRLKEELLKSLK